MKRSQISSNLFFYVLGAIVIALVMIIGYKVIYDVTQDTGSFSAVNFRVRLTNEFNSGATYGTTRRFEANLPFVFREVCFVDLSKKYEILNSISVGLYPLIKDSVDSNAKQNIFLMPQGNPFYAGSATIGHYPYFTCFNTIEGQIEFWLRSLGDSTAVMSEFKSTVEFYLNPSNFTNKNLTLQSPDGVVRFDIDYGTQITPRTQKISVEIVEPGELTQHSESYKFEPENTTFSPPIKLTFNYHEELVGYDCPGDLMFTYNGIEYLSTSIDCENELATFDIDQI